MRNRCRDDKFQRKSRAAPPALKQSYRRHLARAQENVGAAFVLVRRLPIPRARSRAPMRIQTYRDENHSRHFDLVDGSEDPWSVDLVVEAFSFMLLDGFAFALVAVCMR
jgi:hypothetical protein